MKAKILTDTVEITHQHYTWLLKLAISTLEKAQEEDPSWNYPIDQLEEELQRLKNID
jgi:hypothetical protein